MSVAPLRREVLVQAGPELAFEVFTDRIGQWWPLATHSVYGAATDVVDVAFVDGRIVETSPGKPDSVWGTVTSWEPPHRVAFTWHPGHEAVDATTVEVSFTATDDGRTLVRLEHRGWELRSDGVSAREEYGQGWPVVIGAFRDEAARTRATG